MICRPNNQEEYRIKCSLPMIKSIEKFKEKWKKNLKDSGKRREKWIVRRYRNTRELFQVT